MEEVGVIGAGSWGTTLANLLAEKGCRVDLWVREEEVYEQIRRERINRVFLPGTHLHSRVRPVRATEEALAAKEVIVLAVPSHVFRQMLYRIKDSLSPRTALVSATKGIENETLKTMSLVAEDVLGAEGGERFACLAGPSFAREVA
ncbi:MAG: NAD(P)-binding domain-containing protein, partial [Deltaproteobacteria bacterium]|nr:NAD(P)-binding domain-containing protein [Deltaproteobacteria bacterium]